MARGPAKPRREINPDPKFGNVLVERFINHMMKKGKKSVARRTMYDAFDIISEQTKQDPFTIFDSAMRNVSPVLEVKARRVGGANYQIAMEVRSERRLTLAMRWLVEAARQRPEKSMAEKLAAELVAASKKEGATIKKKEDVQKMAEANRAFSHYSV